MPLDSQVNWMSEHYRRIITDQRRWLYNDDWFEWIMREHLGIGKTDDQTLLDVGCGTGYLAFKLAALLPRLSVKGLDNSADLLKEARGISASDFDGRVEFVDGNCYEMPYSDATFDFVCAHTLILHVTEPLIVLKEMARVVKPKGAVFVCEPDNYASFPSGYDSASEGDETDFEWTARRFDYATKLYTGKIKVGEGDSSIARRLPKLFIDTGLSDIFTRKSDRILHLEPPYDTEEKRALADNLRITLSEKNCRKFFPTLRQEYITGGGTETGFDEFWNARIARQNRALDALERGELVWTSNHSLIICAGWKL